MLVYWALLFFFALGAVHQGSQEGSSRAPRSASPMLVIGIVLVIIIVGLRNEVGADWFNYVGVFSDLRAKGLGSALSSGDPGYQFVNWGVKQAGQGIWLVNLVCAAIFGWGLLRFVRAQLDPWLAMVIAIPYFVIVVGMGYTRQAVALGILIAGFGALERGASVIRFAIYVAVAALFHKTAVVGLPLVIFSSKRNRLLNFIAGIALSVLAYDVFLSESVHYLVKNYIDARYGSQGAAIRVTMNLVPAAIFLSKGKQLGFPLNQERIWRAFSLTAVALLIALFVSPSSTAVDRISLYIMPLQLAVLARTPSLFRDWRIGRYIIVAYAVAVQFTWLNFAAHARSWVPYNFYPTSA